MDGDEIRDEELHEVEEPADDDLDLEAEKKKHLLDDELVESADDLADDEFELDKEDLMDDVEEM